MLIVLRILMKIAAALLLIAAASIVAYRCLLPNPKYQTSETFPA